MGHLLSSPVEGSKGYNQMVLQFIKPIKSHIDKMGDAIYDSYILLLLYTPLNRNGFGACRAYRVYTNQKLCRPGLYIGIGCNI